MTTTVCFPSLEWLNAVREVFNSTDSYRGAGGGQCDCTVGLKIDGKIFMIEFEGFGCASVKASDEIDLRNADFFLDMPINQWQEMLRNIHENGHAVGEYTLNTIDLGSEEGIAHAKHDDQYRQDLFVRYNQTLQFFFDASHRVETTFARS
ncbi:MAG: hypothetical protein OXG24_12115 [Gammaproteobacteria bacterium]|nr:hypothetical protein [Gammaproteobacteria bacterium]